MTPQKEDFELGIISLFLSMLGLGLLPLLVFTSPPSLILPGQAHLIGFTFSAICIFGIIAGISPSHCSFRRRSTKSHEKEINESKDTVPKTLRIKRAGHHPSCEWYSSHVISIKGRKYCAGCTGLVTGAIIAFFGTILYFFLNVQLVYAEVIFWTGFVFVAMGLLQHLLYSLFRVHQGLMRVFFNVLFVIGSFLLLASLFRLTNNLTLSSYLLVLILYWIFTRIMMSRRSHRKICAKCETIDCPYSEM